MAGSTEGSGGIIRWTDGECLLGLMVGGTRANTMKIRNKESAVSTGLMDACTSDCGTMASSTDEERLLLRTVRRERDSGIWANE